MKYATLGRTGMKVSKLCVGTWNFGTYTDEKEAFRILDIASEAGINFVDTANAYPDVGLRGLSEQIIGNWFAQGGGRRERTVLATKVYSFTEDPNDGPNDGHGLSIYKIRRHAQASMCRLKTDHIELYQMHHVAPEVGWDELWDAFYRLFMAGSIDYVGGCNFGARHLSLAQKCAAEKHILGMVSEQHKYNLLCRLPELELLPTALELGIGVMPYSPLAEGRLAGSRLGGNDGKSRRKKIDTGTPAGKALQMQVDQFAALCATLGESEANVALAWLLANPAVTSIITGPRTCAQVEDMLHAVDIELTGETMARLDAIFPGPGGSAPAAYAW